MNWPIRECHHVPRMDLGNLEPLLISGPGIGIVRKWRPSRKEDFQSNAIFLRRRIFARAKCSGRREPLLFRGFSYIHTSSTLGRHLSKTTKNKERSVEAALAPNCSSQISQIGHYQANLDNLPPNPLVALCTKPTNYYVATSQTRAFLLRGCGRIESFRPWPTSQTLISIIQFRMQSTFKGSIYVYFAI